MAATFRHIQYFVSVRALIKFSKYMRSCIENPHSKTGKALCTCEPIVHLCVQSGLPVVASFNFNEVAIIL